MNPDFDQIKKTTDIVRVVESYGVALKKTGKEWVGLCPFHEDKTPSLNVNPIKQVFRCPACGAAGNVIQFVAKKRRADRAGSGAEAVRFDPRRDAGIRTSNSDKSRAGGWGKRILFPSRRSR